MSLTLPEAPCFCDHSLMWIYGYPYCSQQPYCFFCQDEINPHDLINRPYPSEIKAQQETKVDDKATLKRKHSPSKEEEEEANKK